MVKLGCERLESNQLPPAYETGEMPFLYAAIIRRDTFLTNARPIELITHKRNTGLEPVTHRLMLFAVCIPKLVPPARLELAKS